MSATDSNRSRRRGQASLPALGVALLVIVTATATTVALADGALASADRNPADRRAASAVAERLVAADVGVTERPNVLNRSAVGNLTASRLDRLVPPVRETAVRVRLGDRTLVERGDPTGGVTVRRVVLVSERSTERRALNLSEADSVTLPRRTARVRLDVNATGGAVRTVRANERVVLHRDAGLDGSATVRTSRYETTTLAFEASDDVDGTVEVAYYPAQTTKAVLAVTVDA